MLDQARSPGLSATQMAARDSLPITPLRGVSSSEDQKDGRNPDVERAKKILGGQGAALAEIGRLAEALKDSRYFGYARRLFALARHHPEAARVSPATKLLFVQRHALCTYKDPDLPFETRFTNAMSILESGDLGESQPSQETLGLAGAIHKNRWKVGGQLRDLEQSLAYYRRGWEAGIKGDHGYTAINAAFMMDVWAAQHSQGLPAAAREASDQAQRIRREIVESLTVAVDRDASVRKQWWFVATLAEACFGLGRFEEASRWIVEGLAARPPEWQVENTTRQLAAIAHARGHPMTEHSEALRTLALLVGDATAAVRVISLGKVGLALSGGGFRASLFHIGVLARLAELDVLRHVEVLSCVSGGSIVGSFYYLEIRRLLQAKADSEISRQDYIDVVKSLESEFLAAVQENLRGRLFSSFLANLRTLVIPGYTRSDYLGELFERLVFARVKDGEQGPRWLDRMDIRPGGDASFNPKLDNWRRSAKAPILLINATTLNTGHNWQFAVKWMGEPPLGASSPVDRCDVLRRMYYWEAPKPYRQIRLGRAVAASACVPALFDPVELNGLFPERSVRLVDGGVHDNQGVAGLIEQECAVLLVSDASGQIAMQARPSGEIHSVPRRASDILMARVRESEYRELDALRRSSALSGLMYLHLKKGLDVDEVSWIDAQDDGTLSDETRAGRLTLTDYGIPKKIQKLLAGLRTDLDSFSDQEAFALMVSGYRMADREFPRCLPAWPIPCEERVDWRFRSFEGAVTLRNEADEREHDQLLKVLRVGQARAFKAWILLPWLKSVGVILAVALGLAVGTWGSSLLFRLPRAAAGFALTAVAVKLLHLLFGSRKSLTVVVTGLGTVTVGWMAALAHLWLIDALYLRAGAFRSRKGRERLG
jgi:predicted acylesterase/phospholipase RssA